MSAAKVYLFDANETLVDLEALDPLFARVFGAGETRALWFGQLLQLFMTATITEEYEPFDVLAGAALDMLAEQRGRPLSADDRESIMNGLLALPAHPDVRPALEKLKGAGVRIAVLTNSTERAAKAQMAHAGLGPLFEAILSADTVRRFKPAREAYINAAHTLDVEPREICLVAAHGWDIAGALAAGCQAAFVARPGKVLSPRATRPAIVGASLIDVAAQILQGDR